MYDLFTNLGWGKKMTKVLTSQYHQGSYEAVGWKMSCTVVPVL